MADRTPVVVGIGLSDDPIAPHLDEPQHHALALRRALDDSGLRKDEIDGYLCAGGSTPAVDAAASMAEYLGIRHCYPAPTTCRPTTGRRRPGGPFWRPAT